jgi:hypothetical protein
VSAAKASTGKHRKRPSALVTSVLILLVGCLLAVWQITDVRADQRLMDTGVRTQGTVERTYNNQHSSGGGRGSKTSKIAVVAYTAAPGDRLTMHRKVDFGGTLPGGSDAPSGQPGQQVTVFYNPDNPSKALVQGWQRRYGYYFYASVALIVLSGSSVVRGARAKLRRRAEAGVATAPPLPPQPAGH